MITIAQDAQFMTNIVAANPIPSGQDFYVVNDALNEAAVFSVSTDNKLEAVLHINGTRQMIDYGSLLGLSVVHALNVQQAPDGSSFFAIAVPNSNDSTKSDLWVMPSVAQNTIHAPSTSSILQMSTTEKITKIYLSEFSLATGAKNQNYPRILLANEPVSQITRLGYVNIADDANGNLQMTLNTSWTGGVDAEKIYDATFLNTGTVDSGGYGCGVAFLYKSAAGTLLDFVSLEIDYHVQLSCPSNAAGLTHFWDDSQSTSCFVVAGDALTHFAYSDYVGANSTGTQLQGSTLSATATGIHSSQDSNDALRIWCTTSSGSACYYTTTSTNTATSLGTLIPFLPDKSFARISSLISTRGAGNTLVDSLISVDTHGNLTLVQKAPTAIDSGAWAARAFFIASNEDSLDIPSYTFRLTAGTDDPSSASTTRNCRLRIRSDGFVSALANGIAVSIDQTGEWFDADAHGSVTLIVSTQDLTSNAITVDGFQPFNGNAQDLTATTIDPSGGIQASLQDQLKNVNSGNDLLALPTQTGGKLITDPNVTGSTADLAVGPLKDLAATTPSGSGNSSAMATELDSDQNQILVGAMDDDSFVEAAWEVFHWFEHLGQEVADFFVTTYNKVKYFTIKWADQVYNFILVTAQQIAKAATWIFNKLKVLVEDLIALLGFLFSWGDIVDTSKSIEALFNSALTYGQTQIDVASSAAQTWINGLSSDLKNAPQADNTAAGSNYSDPNASPDQTSTTNGAHFHWTSYQMTHGGFMTNSSITSSTSLTVAAADQATDDWQTMFNAIQNEATAIETFTQSMINDMKSLFTPNTDSSSVYKMMEGSAIDLLISTLNNLVQFLASGTKLIASEFQSALNATITVPIFTVAWKAITNQELTVLNLISVVLAIPTTVVYKVVAKSAPPKLDGRLTSDTFGQYVDGTGDASLASDISRVLKALAPAVALMAGVAGVLLDLLTDTPASALTSEAAPESVGPMAVLATGRGDPPVEALIWVRQVVTGLGLFLAWPLKNSNAMNYRWGAWSLSLTSALVSSVGQIAYLKEGVELAVSNKVTGPLNGLIALPAFALNMAVDANSLTNPKADKVLIAVNMVTAVFVVIGFEARLVTGSTKGVDGPIPQAAFAVGEVVSAATDWYITWQRIGFFIKWMADGAK